LIDTSQEVLLDLRELEPPEPFVQSLAALAQLAPMQYLHLVHHREPAMLYPELAPRGFVSQTGAQGNGLFHIMVWRQTEAATGELAIKRLAQLIADA